MSLEMRPYLLFYAKKSLIVCPSHLVKVDGVLHLKDRVY